MMNYIWGLMVVLSVIISLFNGTTQQVSEAVLTGAQDAVELLITMLGMMCLWSGLMQIAEQGGLTRVLAKVFAPVLSKLFPAYKNDQKTSAAICSNVTANILGLGNAATPLGLEAMRRMNQSNKIPRVANNSMVMFVILNTASIQLIPTTISILRQSAGAAVPMDITPCIWISSVFALLVGVTMAKLFEKKEGAY